MAFFIELAMVQKTPLRILNVNHDSHQGDHVILEIAKEWVHSLKKLMVDIV